MRSLLDVTSQTRGEPPANDVPERSVAAEAEAIAELVGESEALVWVENGRVVRVSEAARRLYGFASRAPGVAFARLERGREVAEASLFDALDAPEEPGPDAPTDERGSGAFAAAHEPPHERSGTFSIPDDYRALHLRADGAAIEVEVKTKRLPGARSVLLVRPVPVATAAPAEARASEDAARAATLQQTHRMATVGAVAAGVVHEINNPMTCVHANLEFAAQTLEELQRLAEPESAELIADVASAVADAREGAQQALKLARELKQLARSEVARLELVDPCAAIASAAKLVNVRVRERARVTQALEADARVMVDEGRLAQILLNLILNAAEALPERSAPRNEIHLSCRRLGDEVRIEVRDNGVGIEPALARRLFTPFVSERLGGGGLGLGLSICRDLAAAMGAELGFQSTPGEGTTFRLSLRAASASSPPPKRAP